MLTVSAPAKVNLHLGIGAPRADGYHGVSTVLHALELHDTLTFSPQEGLTVTCVPDIGVGQESNLAYRAAVALALAHDRDPGVAITIEKRIPHGAGLGGGSSDAAAVIAALAALWDLDPLDTRCLHVAASLGADVSFFLEPSGCALMGGRGDVVEHSLPPLSGTPVVVVRPDDGVSTAAAYAAFDDAPVPPADPSAILAALERGDAEGVARSLSNNMEAASFRVVPAVANALAWLREDPGVLGATVAGSGSAVFGICASDESAARVANAAEMTGLWAVPTRLGTHGVRVSRTGEGR